MAIAILQAIVNHKPIEHTLEHDMESFIWVLSYAIPRKILKVTEAPNETAKHPLRQQIATDFKDCFGSLSVSDIAKSRKALVPLGFFDEREAFLSPYVSSPLRDLLVQLRVAMRTRLDGPAIKRVTTVFRHGALQAPATATLTHAWLIDYIDDAIHALENDPSLQR